MKGSAFFSGSAGISITAYAPASAATKATTMQGITALHGVAVERAYWIAAPVVPMADASLLVPSSGGGATPGINANSAGSCTMPPPPITASTTPAPNAAAPSAVQISNVPVSSSKLSRRRDRGSR